MIRWIFCVCVCCCCLLLFIIITIVVIIIRLGKKKKLVGLQAVSSSGNLKEKFVHPETYYFMHLQTIFPLIC